MHWRRAITALLVVFGLGCASGAAKDEAGGGELTFLDSGLFDQSLSKTMWRKTNPIMVNLAAPATLNDVPERLDKWLYQIGEKTGGSVNVEPDPALPQDRSIAMIGLSLAMQAYEFAKEKMTYHPAGNYDATIFVDPADGRITRVMFSLRQEALPTEPEAGS